MRFLQYLFMMLVAVVASQAETDYSVKLLTNNTGRFSVSIAGGTGDNLYLSVDSLLYHRDGIDGDWDLIYTFPQKDFYKLPGMGLTVKFFKKDNSNIYVACKNILYAMDNVTHDLNPVYSVTNQIESVVFDDDKIVIIEENAYHVVDLNFETLEYYDFSSIDFKYHEDNYRRYILSYAREFGFLYNLVTYQDMYEEQQAFAATNNFDILTESGKIVDSDKYVKNVVNYGNNLIGIITGEWWSDTEIYLYDFKTKSKVESPFEQNYSMYNQISENGDILTTSTGVRDNQKYSTDRGKTWITMNDFESENLCATEAGMLYGYNLEVGIYAYNLQSKQLKTIDFPIPLSRDIYRTDNFRYINGEIWADFLNSSMVKSTDNGRTFSIVLDAPVDGQDGDNFYIDGDNNVFFASLSGLYKNKEDGTWELLTQDYTSLPIKECKVIDADDSRVLVSLELETRYELYEFAYENNSFTNLNKPFVFISKLNDKYLLVSENDQSKLIEYSKDFVEQNTIDLAADLAVLKAITDSQGNLYLATSKGLFKYITSHNNLELLGDIQQPVYNMFFNQNDTLLVDYVNEDGNLYFVQPSSNTLETVENSSGWDKKNFEFLEDNIAIFHYPGTNHIGYNELFTQLPIALNIEYPDTYYVGEEHSIKISTADMAIDNYQIKIINYSSLNDTTIQAQAAQVEYALDFKPYQKICLQVIGSKEGYADFVSDLIEIKTDMGERDVRIIPNISKWNITWDTDQTVEYSFNIETALATDTKKGKISIHNALDNKTTDLDYDGTNSALYQFEIPVDAQNGIYKIKYSGNSEEYGAISEAYFYYIVHDTYFDSVEEPNSIITNTNVYPNPAVSNVEVQFEMKEAGNLTCDIYDLNGNKVLSIPTSGYYAAGQSNLSFDVSNLAGGQYMIFLKAQDKVTAAKLIVNR